MIKKIISGLCTLSVLLTCALPSVFSARAQSTSLTLPQGCSVKWDFDGCTAVSSADTQWVTKDASQSARVTIETDTENVYGGSGKALKFDYVDGMRVWRNTTTKVSGDAIAVWVKSDRNTSLTMLGLINGWSNTGELTLSVNKGENILLFYFKDFICNSAVSGNITTINQLQFITSGTGTMWVDSISYYTQPSADDTLWTDFPDGTQNKWNFDSCSEISSSDTEWVTKEASDSAQLTLESNTANVYGGSGKSIKWSYTDSKRLWAGNREIAVLGDGVVMWVKSDRDTALTLYGYINGWNTVAELTVNIKAGENFVYYKYSDMTFKNPSDFSETTPPAKITKFIQMQLISSGMGTVWIDSIGFYTEPLPTDPEYSVPDTVYKHGLDFCELSLKESAWVNRDPVNTDFRVISTAAKYHSGNTNVGDNSSAMRIAYKKLENVELAYGEKIGVLKLDEELKDEDSVLSFWTWSSQPIKLKVGLTADKTVSVPAGESIVKIALSELLADGSAADYSNLYQLKVTAAADVGSVSEGLLYLDAFGFYNTGYVINTDKLSLPESSFIWWDFDQYETIEMLGNDWTKHWAGAEDKGVSLSMEEDSSNIYGADGRSLKIVYDRAAGEWNNPGVWHSSLMTTYGEGFAFWIKSNEKTTFDLVCLDAEYRAVQVKEIPLNIGENVITVSYDDFTFVTPVEGETPKMSKVSQWQIRMSGCNNGTLWLDSFAFYGIADDGSNTSKFLNPPDSYDNFEEGNHSAGDDFEAWSGDDDLEFCTDWYYEDKGWITLEKHGDSNTVLKMDYNMSTKTSVLKNITVFEDVDPNGGISFWAQSSEERNYKVNITLGNKSISTVIRGSAVGRYYKIPFSEFWMSSDISVSYEADSKELVNVTYLEILTDASVNPPALDASPQCTLWLDDICFVDSLAYKRAGAVNYYENGVRLIAGEDAFKSGVDPIFTVLEVSKAQAENYLSQMRDADRFGSLISLKAYDMSGIPAIPTRSVELIFDVPSGIDPENVVVYQSYVDGSVLKTATTVGLDGKLHATVYRLGDYAICYSSLGGSMPKTGDSGAMPYAVLVSLSAFMLLVISRHRNLRLEEQP